MTYPIDHLRLPLTAIALLLAGPALAQSSSWSITIPTDLITAPAVDTTGKKLTFNVGSKTWSINTDTATISAPVVSTDKHNIAFTAVEPLTTQSTAPDGPALTNTTGTWTWNGPSSVAGETNVALGGTNKGSGVFMQIGSDGRLYLKNAAGAWKVWTPAVAAGFKNSSAPPG